MLLCLQFSCNEYIPLLFTLCFNLKDYAQVVLYYRLFFLLLHLLYTYILFHFFHFISTLNIQVIFIYDFTLYSYVNYYQHFNFLEALSCFLEKNPLSFCNSGSINFMRLNVLCTVQ